MTLFWSIAIPAIMLLFYHLATRKGTIFTAREYEVKKLIEMKPSAMKALTGRQEKEMTVEDLSRMEHLALVVEISNCITIADIERMHEKVYDYEKRWHATGNREEFLKRMRELYDVLLHNYNLIQHD